MKNIATYPLLAIYLTVLFFVVGCASVPNTDQKNLLAENNLDNAFKFDNVLMRQSELLAYSAFKKYVAIEGVVTKVVSDKPADAVLMLLSNEKNSELKVWVFNFGRKEDVYFSVGSRVRVLGYPHNKSEFELSSEIIKDDYFLQGMCMFSVENGRVVYQKSALTICEHWQNGRLHKIKHLTSRLK